MIVYELLKGKYVIVRPSKYGDDYYKEDNCGYTKEIIEAGIYEQHEIKQDIPIISLEEYNNGKHKKKERYAVALSTLLTLM